MHGSLRTCSNLRVITLGALNRNESRGAHYKPDFPERDENFMKTTIAEYSAEAPVLSYEPIDVSLVEPRKRDYSKSYKILAFRANSMYRKPKAKTSILFVFIFALPFSGLA